jgi:response regulator RpfG family c-di-GMP phosphodiesterase
VIIAVCEVARMLSDRVGLPASTSALFIHMGERWDGNGVPGRVRRDELPLPMRIVQVARDAALQRLLRGEQFAAEVIRERAGSAFDPDIAVPLADHAAAILAIDVDRSVCKTVLTCEPVPRRLL